MSPKKSAATVGVSGSMEDVGRIFQQIHKSAAHFHKCKASLLKYAENNFSGIIEAVCRVELLVLKESPRLATDSLKRHYNFVAEVCKGFRERFQTDEIAVALLKTVEPFHNANDKTVRLGVISVFAALLKTMDQTNTSEERQNFYQKVAEMLKLRVHDKFPAVREQAVSAISCFQSGKKDCDVTQHLMALLCTDPSADVRRQLLRSVCGRKEFLEGYFHGMIRCVRDVVSRVRVEAWDALSRFHWKYITAYTAAKNIPFQELIHQGLSDANSSVSIACRAALTNCWLHRDYRDDSEAMLELVLSGGALEPYEVISTEMILYHRKHKSKKTFVVNFECVSAASLLLWKENAKLSADTEEDDETAVLLPLPQFSLLLQDTVYAYARPEVEPKNVKFKNVDEADIILRILLSVFDVYEENGYLAHADNTTRNTLLRIIGFLLKVVPDDDPAMFIDVTVRSLKSLTGRTPEEATHTITSSLDSIFRSLKLPQMYALGYDDVEAFGRKSRERQRDLFRLRMKLRGGEATQEEYDRLKEEMDRDEKFLLRMQFIVLAFLSNSQRGDTIPTFCSHVIQLGRQQDNEVVKVVSTTSLGLQCLVNPDTVHTFMPLIMIDAKEIVSSSDRCVALAALGVVFDLVMEYGLRFFDCPTREALHSNHHNINNNSSSAAELGIAKVAAATTTTTTTNNNNNNNNNATTAPTTKGFLTFSSSSAIEDAPPVTDVEARIQHERDLAHEDEHKVGGNNLLNTLRSFLRTHCVERNPMVVAGFCKLLSCNRVPHVQVPEIIADILMQFMAFRQEEKGNAHAAYMVEFLNKFLYSFASSHPNRQLAFAQGGVIAFRALLRFNSMIAMRLMEVITRLSDAYVLVQIREIDPETARQIARLAEGKNRSVEESTSTRNTSARTAATRTSTQSARLLRELSRFSLHEYIASELLIELAETDSKDASATCLDILEKRMYFYAKETPTWLLFCADRALESLDGDAQCRLKSWRDEVCLRFAAPASSGEAADEANATKWQESLEARERAVEKLLESDVANVLCQTVRSEPPPKENSDSSRKMEKKRGREPDTAFGINSILSRQQRRTRR